MKLIEHIQVLQPGEGVVGQSLLIDSGSIRAIDPAEVPAEAQRIDGGGLLATPGLIDVHTHGFGHDSYDGSAERLEAIVQAVRTTGVTSLLATLVPSDTPECIAHIGALARAIEAADLTGRVGLHLEGPFVAVGGAACKTIAGDLELLQRLADAAGEHLRAMAIAPDVENILPVIEWLARRDVAVFITHTRASYEQTVEAIDAGARHATHFYDVFYPPEARDGGVRPVGAVEAILADPRCTVDFIADGVHVHRGAIQLALRAKGPAGVCAITDANIGTGLAEGVYPTPWGFPIEVGPRGGARNADPDHPSHGGLAGSVLTMDRAISNLMAWLDQPAEETWAMATSNPAGVVGWADRGRFAPGLVADLVLWTVDGTHCIPEQTWLDGQCVWRK